MSSRRTFPTKFVWDHGGQTVNLCITKPEGKETVPLNRSDSGTFEITANLGQGRYEYCFCVDGAWTHDPDLPAIKNEKGHYSNMLKIVDPKINFSNKAAKVENRNKVEEEGGIHNFVEKCFSDATIHEMMERENVKSLNLTSESEDDTSEDDSESDFPDLDSALAEALDVAEPKFLAESPLPGKKLISIQNVDKNLNVSFGSSVDNVIVENNKNNQITITAVQKPLERKNKIERNTEVQHFSSFEQPVLANENGVSESNNQGTIQEEKKNEGNVSLGNEEIAEQNIGSEDITEAVRKDLEKSDDPVIKTEKSEIEISSAEMMNDSLETKSSINDLTAEKASHTDKEISGDLLEDKTHINGEVNLIEEKMSLNTSDAVADDNGLVETKSGQDVNDGFVEDTRTEANDVDQATQNGVNVHCESRQDMKVSDELSEDKTSQNKTDICSSEEKPSLNNEVNGDLPEEKESQDHETNGEPAINETFQNLTEEKISPLEAEVAADPQEEKASHDVPINGASDLAEAKLLSEEKLPNNVSTSETEHKSNTEENKDTHEDLENKKTTECEGEESLKEVKMEAEESNEEEKGSSVPGEVVTSENKNSLEKTDFPGDENTSKSPLVENVNEDELINPHADQDVKQDVTQADVNPREMTNYVTEADLEDNNTETETEREHFQILSSVKDNNLTSEITDQDSEIRNEIFERAEEIKDTEEKRSEKLPFIETDLDSFVMSQAVSSNATLEEALNVKISESLTLKPPFIETDLDSPEEIKITDANPPISVLENVDHVEIVTKEEVTVGVDAEDIPRETNKDVEPSETSLEENLPVNVQLNDNEQISVENESEIKTALESQKIQATDINGDSHISEEKNDNNVGGEVKENIIEMNNSSCENDQKLSKSVEAVNDPPVMLVEERQELTNCDHQTNNEGNEEKLKLETSKLIEQNIIEFQESNKTETSAQELESNNKTEEDVKLDNNCDKNNPDEQTIAPASVLINEIQNEPDNSIESLEGPVIQNKENSDPSLLNCQKEESAGNVGESSEDLQENTAEQDLESNAGTESIHLSENNVEDEGDKPTIEEEKPEDLSTPTAGVTIESPGEMEISGSIAPTDQVTSQESDMISSNQRNTETSEEINEMKSVEASSAVSDEKPVTTLEKSEEVEVTVNEEKSQDVLEPTETSEEKETSLKEEDHVLGNTESKEVNEATEDTESEEKPNAGKDDGEPDHNQLKDNCMEESPQVEGKNKNIDDSELLNEQEKEIIEKEVEESKEYDKLSDPGDFPADTNDLNNPERDHSALDETNDKSDQTENSHQTCLINIENGTNDRDHVADVTGEEQEEERATLTADGSSKDLFRQVNNTMYQIERSKSTAGLKSAEFMEIQKSQSKSEVKPPPVNDVDTGDTDSVKSGKSIKDKLGAVKDKMASGINKVKDNFSKINNKKDGDKQEKPGKSSEKESKQSHQDLMEQRRLANKEKMELMKMSKKLDEVFGVIRTEPVEEIKTEITVRGMGNINLKRGAVKKTEVEHNKMDQYDQKRASRQQIAMPDKPATFKKPQKVMKEESPKAVEVEEPKPEPPPPPTPKTKKSNFMFIPKPATPPKDPTPPPPKEPTPPPPKEPTPPESPEKTPTPPPPEKSPTPPPTVKEKTPDLTTKFWPTTKLPSPGPVVAEEEPADPIQLQPEKPLKVGINGFDRIGRLAFRAALESGLEVGAINDPFIPLHYMVYSLKFDMAHSKTRKKEMTVIESPTGHLIVNDKEVSVFKEVDPRKIPWNTIGVNYVIEATESLQSKVNARHHLEPDEKGLTMKELVNKKGAGEMTENPEVTPENVVTDIQCTVKKVVVASGCSEFPSFGIGVNDDRLSKSSSVICSMSAQANAMVLPLKIIQELLGIKFCSYTLMKAIMGPSKDIKCPTLGPSTHRKTLKWDFSENLVPAPCPVLEEEVIRHMPAMRGKLHGMVVYTPVPEVSMFDLTIHVNTPTVDLYHQVCQTIRTQAAGPLKHVLSYRASAGEETSASGIFSGSSFSVIFDERSGCQIDQSTLKIVLWFDNEHGFANRLVDLVKKSYDVNCNQ